MKMTIFHIMYYLYNDFVAKSTVVSLSLDLVMDSFF